MPRIDDDTSTPLVFTSNTQWLEEIDSRRSLSPEEMLTVLEEMLEQGELTHEELLTYLQDLRS
jgi:hypothetical protein